MTPHFPTPIPTAPVRDFDRLRVHSFPAGRSHLALGEERMERPLLLLWIRGAGSLRQHGGTVLAPTGSLCLLAGDAPVSLDVGPGGAIAVELPADFASRVRERASAALGRVITADGGAAAFLRSFLDTLDQQAPGYRPDHPGWVQTCVCDITDRVLAECIGVQPTAAERAVLAAKDYVATHLTDLDLTPYRVAREAAVSLRTLNRMFAAEGDSICGWIRVRRLERCREDLLDPGRADRSISQIGAFWGFLDAAHFSRAFKDAYGCSPRAFRAAAHGAAAPPAERDRRVA